jgi:hypothetical protein
MCSEEAEGEKGRGGIGDGTRTFSSTIQTYDTWVEKMEDNVD